MMNEEDRSKIRSAIADFDIYFCIGDWTYIKYATTLLDEVDTRLSAKDAQYYYDEDSRFHSLHNRLNDTINLTKQETNSEKLKHYVGLLDNFTT